MAVRKTVGVGIPEPPEGEYARAKRLMIERVARDVSAAVVGTRAEPIAHYAVQPTDHVLEQMADVVQRFESYGAQFVINGSKEKDELLEGLREANDMRELLESVSDVRKGNQERLRAFIEDRDGLSDPAAKILALVISAARKACDDKHLKRVGCTCNSCVANSLLSTFRENDSLSWLVNAAFCRYPRV